MPYKPKITTRGISTTTVTTDSIPKNAPMTNDELDSNFLNIRDASIGIASDDSTVIDIGLGNTLKVIGAGGVTTAVSGQSITIDGSGISGGGTNSFSTIAVAGQSNVVADSTTDTLTLAAGDGISITTSASTDTITITNSSPNNTGNLPFAKSIGTTANSGGSDTIATGASAHDMYFKTSGDGTYNFINTTSEVGIGIADSGLSTGGIASGKLTAIIGGDGLYLVGTPVYIKADNTVVGLTNNDHTITTFGTGNLTLSTNQGTNSGTITIVDGANSNITLTPNGTGSVVIDSISIKDNTISNNASDSDIQIKSAGTGTVDFSVPTATTIGANGAASALTANPVGYIKIKVNGTTYQLPYYNI
jgi:hypothetical protein